MKIFKILGLMIWLRINFKSAKSIVDFYESMRNDN